MFDWNKLRTLLLALTFGSTLFAFGKATLNPNLGTYTPFAFPPEVSLDGWQSLGSSPLNRPNPQLTQFIAGSRYQYIHDGVPLDIDMHYESTNGDIKAFIQNYTSINSLPSEPSQVIRQQSGVGYYVLFNYQGRAYLSSCINPRGGSTVTSEQFLKNRNTYDMQLSRLFPWLLGQEELRDWRCLWTHLSIPLNQVNNAEVERSYQILENAWFLWYRWWSSRFPKL